MPRHDILAPAPAGARPTPTLQSLRAAIDRIDDELLALIERRLSHARAIAARKQDDHLNALLLRPDRERDVVARLTARTDALPDTAIAAVWRELMAVSLQTQRRTEIVLHAGAQPVAVTNVVRQRFGCAAPIVVAGGPEEALARARSREAIAVIELDPLSSWWVDLFHDRALVIFDWLGEGPTGAAALAVGRMTGDCRPRGVTFPIVGATTLARRMAEGEDIRPLAMCGHLRLCISRSEGAMAAEEPVLRQSQGR
ncbi:MAG: chorismate mutase [Sphingomonas sp.]|nr:chorismate mutase [Sphingomonas sp.]